MVAGSIRASGNGRPRRRRRRLPVGGRPARALFLDHSYLLPLTASLVSLDWGAVGDSRGGVGKRGWGGGNRDGGRHVSVGWHVGNSWNVRNDVLNQGRSWHQEALVTGWAWNGNLAEHWRDDWGENWACDQASWLVPVGSCETSLGQGAVGSGDALDVSDVRCGGEGRRGGNRKWAGQVGGLREADEGDDKDCDLLVHLVVVFSFLCRVGLSFDFGCCLCELVLAE